MKKIVEWAFITQIALSSHNAVETQISAFLFGPPYWFPAITSIMMELCKRPFYAKGVDGYENEVHLRVALHVAAYGGIADQVERCVAL